MHIQEEVEMPESKQKQLEEVDQPYKKGDRINLFKIQLLQNNKD